METIEIINWIFILFPILAMNELSKKDTNIFRANLFYTIGNIWSLYYFYMFEQWSWLFLYAVFTYFATKGMIKHKDER